MAAYQGMASALEAAVPGAGAVANVPFEGLGVEGMAEAGPTGTGLV